MNPPALIHALAVVTLKETRTLLRSRRAFWFMMFTLAVVGGAFLVVMLGHGGDLDLNERNRFARTLFTVLSFSMLCIMGLVTPLMTATAFTAEREHKTLDLLYCLAVPRLALVLGKWLAAIIYQFAIVLCLLPILSLVFQLGGVGLDEVLYSASVIAVAVAAYGMVGLAISVRARRSFKAMMFALGFALLLNIGIYLVLLLEVSISPRLAFNNDMLVFWSVFSPLLNLAWSFELSRVTTPGNLFTNMKFMGFLGFHASLFLLAAFYAWRHLKRGETLKPVIATRIIDDPALLARRRRRFPYYLVDPLRRAQVIGDRQDPLQVKEQRIGGAGRLQASIRLGYVGLGLSVMFLGFVFSNLDAMGVMAALAQASLGFVALFAPVLTATVISREREEGTWDLLRTIPVPPGRIVRAKFRSVLRALAIMLLSATLIPVAGQFLVVLTGFESNGTFPQSAVALLKFIPFTAAFLMLYGAVGVCCSAFCRRNATAIAAGMLIMLLMYFLPAGLVILVKIFIPRYSVSLPESMIKMFLAFICPFLSPFYSLDDREWNNSLNHDEAWTAILIRAFVITLLAAALLYAASRRLASRKDER